MQYYIAMTSPKKGHTQNARPIASKQKETSQCIQYFGTINLSKVILKSSTYWKLERR